MSVTVQPSQLISSIPPAYDRKKYGEPLVRMRDLSVRDPELRSKYIQTLTRFLDHGMLIKGHEVQVVEEQLNSLTSKKHNILVSCASSGLLIALQAANIKPGDEVITTPLSWLMTSSVIAQIGAIPIFVDVCDDYNMDISRVANYITSRTKAVMPVHYYGKYLDTSPLRKLCDKHNLVLIEDCAQAAGSSVDGLLAGHNSDISVISFGFGIPES